MQHWDKLTELDARPEVAHLHGWYILASASGIRVTETTDESPIEQFPANSKKPMHSFTVLAIQLQGVM